MTSTTLRAVVVQQIKQSQRLGTLCDFQSHDSFLDVIMKSVLQHWILAKTTDCKTKSPNSSTCQQAGFVSGRGWRLHVGAVYKLCEALKQS